MQDSLLRYITEVHIVHGNITLPLRIGQGAIVVEVLPCPMADKTRHRANADAVSRVLSSGKAFYSAHREHQLYAGYALAHKGQL